MVRPFSDFAAKRHGFAHDKEVKPEGLLNEVKQATQRVDKMLLLAERGPTWAHAYLYWRVRLGTWE